MSSLDFKDITIENLSEEHICCAISDKKHQDGVIAKKKWLEARMDEGLVFKKLDTNGKVFIEYMPAKNAWVPINADDYLYIHCLWVSGSFKGNGYAKALLQSCIDDAKARGMRGIVTISSKKKRPYLSEKKFFIKQGFTVVDSAPPDFELLALNFNERNHAQFKDSVKKPEIADQEGFVFYYVPQCPYIPNCLKEIEKVADELQVKVSLHEMTSKEEAQSFVVPWTTFAVFKDGEFISNTLLNGNSFKKLVLLYANAE